MKEIILILNLIVSIINLVILSFLAYIVYVVYKTVKSVRKLLSKRNNFLLDIFSETLEDLFRASSNPKKDDDENYKIF